MYANARHAILVYIPSACAHTAVAGASRGVLPAVLGAPAGSSDGGMGTG